MLRFDLSEKKLLKSSKKTPFPPLAPPPTAPLLEICGSALGNFLHRTREIAGVHSGKFCSSLGKMGERSRKIGDSGVGWRRAGERVAEIQKI